MPRERVFPIYRGSVNYCCGSLWQTERRELVEDAGKGMPEGGNFRVARAINECDDEIAHRRHDLGSVARAQPGAIFPEVDIADIMQAILDMPMPTDEREKALKGGLISRQAGDERDDLLGGLSLARQETGHASYLGHQEPGSWQIGNHLGAEFDLLHFRAPPSSISRRDLHIMS